MTAPAPSDAELVRAWCAGDEAAARALVHRHAAAVGRYLLGQGAATSAVDDLLQETFFRAFRGIASWRGDGAFRAWLLRIARNVFRDGHRRTRGVQFVEAADDDRVETADGAGELDAQETEQQLLDGLTRLSPLQREVFLLRVEQGLAYREIATTLETTEGAARVHYHQAVRRLKEWLQ